MKTIKLFCIITALLFTVDCSAISIRSDSVIIRIHFLHGSKPKREFRHEEDRWFGGVLGGHAGIEISPNKILNFQPKSRPHLFSKRSIINSKFSFHDTISFYEILGGKSDSVKKTIISIKISAKQKNVLDSIVLAYTKRCPYDYAFFGMRCGSAVYDVLAQTGVVRKLPFKKTWRRIFYPRKLRRLLEYGNITGFVSIRKENGSKKRKWEKD
ncbi:MAG: hypothetical protein Q8M29_16945 [Bacteroidota bacterium]|nr:hypothetical protein [Bacteroidota bacterium]